MGVGFNNPKATHPCGDTLSFHKSSPMPTSVGRNLELAFPLSNPVHVTYYITTANSNRWVNEAINSKSSGCFACLR